MTGEEARERLKYARAALTAWWHTRRAFRRHRGHYWAKTFERRCLTAAMRRYTP